jgi:hypothetical protein
LGSGFTRTILADPNVEPNIVPVDTVVNTMIVIAWYRSTQSDEIYLQKKNQMLPVIHCCSDKNQLNSKCLTSQQWSKLIIVIKFYILLFMIIIVDTIIEQINKNKIAFEKCIRWPQLNLGRNK